MDRTCADCAKPISKYSKSGLCFSCWQAKSNRDPERIARRAAAIREKHKLDPTIRLRIAAGVKAFIAGSPEEQERRRNEPHLKDMHIKGVAAARHPEVLARRARTISEMRMAWCPKELREEYKYLTRIKSLRHAEAKRIILAQHEKNMADFRKSLEAA